MLRADATDCPHADIFYQSPEYIGQHANRGTPVNLRMTARHNHTRVRLRLLQTNTEYDAIYV